MLTHLTFTFIPTSSQLTYNRNVGISCIYRCSHWQRQSHLESLICDNSSTFQHNMIYFLVDNVGKGRPYSQAKGSCQKRSTTVHNIGISLLLSTSVWVLFRPPIEHWETRPMAKRPCPWTGVAKEGRPKFNPRPGQGLNLVPSGW